MVASLDAALLGSVVAALQRFRRRHAPGRTSSLGPRMLRGFTKTGVLPAGGLEPWIIDRAGVKIAESADGASRSMPTANSEGWR